MAKHISTRFPEEYIAQICEEIEGTVFKKLSQEFTKTESRILGALSKLDEFLLNPQVRTLSGTVPGTFRNADVENWEPSGDRSQSDPLPEEEFSACPASNLTDSNPDEISHRNPKLEDNLEAYANLELCNVFFL